MIDLNAINPLYVAVRRMCCCLQSQRQSNCSKQVTPKYTPVLAHRLRYLLRPMGSNFEEGRSARDKNKSLKDNWKRNSRGKAKEQLLRNMVHLRWRNHSLLILVLWRQSGGK